MLWVQSCRDSEALDIPVLCWNWRRRWTMKQERTWRTEPIPTFVNVLPLSRSYGEKFRGIYWISCHSELMTSIYEENCVLKLRSETHYKKKSMATRSTGQHSRKTCRDLPSCFRFAQGTREIKKLFEEDLLLCTWGPQGFFRYSEHQWIDMLKWHPTSSLHQHNSEAPLCQKPVRNWHGPPSLSPPKIKDQKSCTEARDPNRDHKKSIKPTASNIKKEVSGGEHIYIYIYIYI